MSPRRRRWSPQLVLVLLVGAGLVGAQVLRTAAPAVDPVARPAQDRPGPVLLVPGYGGSRAGLLQLAGRIEATGRSATVLTLAGDGTGDLSAQVAVLDTAVDAALAAGAPSVDVVGYSAGGVVAGLWVARDDGAAKARRIVTLGAPLAGASLAATATVVAPDACPAACRQLAPGTAEISRVSPAGAGGRGGAVAVRVDGGRRDRHPPAAAAQPDGQLRVRRCAPGRGWRVRRCRPTRR